MNSPGDQPDLDAAIRAIMAGRDLSALAEDLRRDRLPQAAPDGSRFGMHVNKPIKLPEPPYDPITLTVLVELEDANPEIWRRLELRGDQRLDQLHEVLQAAMGWNNSHLHRFNRSSERDYFLTEFDEHEGTAGTPEREVRLDQVLRQPGDSLNYEYDFGDGWEHVLRVTDVRTCATDDPVARCEAGERACPPDDIGGIHRWNELAAQLWPVEDLRNLRTSTAPGSPSGWIRTGSTCTRPTRPSPRHSSEPPPCRGTSRHSTGRRRRSSRSRTSSAADRVVLRRLVGLRFGPQASPARRAGSRRSRVNSMPSGVT
ncbi:plasmid pRiA4b ORF-3 family protein [Calidifontibacter indicus]|uniref:PRiA4b ORF-3-like protein n=1 Tax=Calidifontibacter indicus TaxID=419650 RepID=A0A3D9UJY5_9MICO|nr:plasmid pRiA4b ORF-3 family protein [Calidifontibacter indicus]REF29626.1 pRiA4b ORF-3-like protein [Calidifontibacter indicus]